ncbi:M66 family metalloprotease [Photobacterium leiognathi]|uniref:M66 family metalloprotease n=1 Tax=Photobacterium leiognathi TaxID=553611 RepID=UPI002982518A|nr:M66 family metalloprotease [Photobacterium leiognathi]
MSLKKTLLASIILINISGCHDNTESNITNLKPDISDSNTDNKKPIIDVTPSKPTFGSSGIVTGMTGQPVHGQIKASANKGAVITYSISNNPSWLTINPNTGELSGTPHQNDNGDYTITVTATNGKQTNSIQVSVVIGDSNHAPTILPVTAQNIVVNTPFTVAVSANDKDNNRLTYRLINAPVWAKIDAVTGIITGKPTAVGKHPLKIEVSDGKAKAFTSVMINTVVNPTPVVTIAGKMTARTRQPFVAQISAKDPNGKPLHFTLSGQPSWMQINPKTGVISGTPGRDDNGDFTFTITASNGQQQVTSTVQIVVEDVNKAPTWTPFALQTMTAGNTMDITATASDEDNDPLTYSLSNAPAWLMIDSKTGVIIATPDIKLVGDFTAIVTASDGKLSADTTLKIHVNKGQFEITTHVNGIGTISPDKMTVVAGDNGEFTIKFDSKNKLKSITGCDGSLVDNKYLVSDVHADCQIQVNYEDVGYIPPLAFNTNNYPSDLDGNLEATVLFAQNHVIPSKNHKADIVHLHNVNGSEITHTPAESTQHLIGERSALVMFKAKDADFDETLPVKVEGYDVNGSKLGTLVLERPYKIPSISGVNAQADLTKVDFNLDPSKLTAIDTAKVADEGEKGDTAYLDQQLIESKNGVLLHSTQWLRLHQLFLNFNPKFDGKYLIVKADSPFTTDVRYANSISKGERNAYMGINIGQTVVFYNIGGQWFTSGDLAISKVTYGHGYWTAKIPASWMHYGLRLDFAHDGKTGTLDNINVGAPTVLYMNTIDIGMLTQRQDTMEFAKDLELPREYYQTLPISRLVVSRYQGITFDEIMMPNGQLYTDYSPGIGGWQEGDMRSDIAKSLISIGIDSANFGFNASDGPGQDAHSDLALMLTAHTSIGRYLKKREGDKIIEGPWNQDHGGSGGGGIVTLTGTVGNEMSHEAGHGIELSHSEGYDMSIHHPADQQDSTWGWDSDKNVFIPNFYKNPSNKASCIGDPNKGEEKICVQPWEGFQFGTDAMYGGEGSMYPDNRYTMYTPFSSTKMQRVMEGRMVFSEESPTGYLKWNKETHEMEPFSYSHQIVDINNANINKLGNKDGLEYLTKLLVKSNIVDITTGNGNWIKFIPIPDASNVPNGSIIRLQSWAGYNSYYTINKTEITFSYGMHKIYRSNGLEWIEINSVNTSIHKKPEQFGVPVTTLVGYYDPEEKLTSYIYPALHGSRGYTYADDSEYIKSNSCHLDVELESGHTKQFWLPNNRLSENVMNKFHVNIAESDNPVNAAVICDDKILSTKPVSKPNTILIPSVNGSPLTNIIS